jgi:hypothetical protein
MPAATAPAHDSSESLSARLRNALVGTAFAFVLVIPRLLHLRRNPRSWAAFRVLLGIAGAALVILPLSLWNSYLLAIVGLFTFIAAILLPPAYPDTRAEDKARELGALVVVNGGRYQPGNGPSAPVRLYVGCENLWALDAHLQPLVVVPIREIASAHAERFENQWLLQIRWDDNRADFAYRGVFAEHLARVAESTIRGVIRPSLPVLSNRRAAGAS